MHTDVAPILSRLPLGSLASPARFYALAGRLVPWLAAAAMLLALAALWVGLMIEPRQAQQGAAWRIVFMHVPAAWMSLFLYVLMAFYALLTLLLTPRLPSMMMTALAPTGAMFTILALATGLLWGRPTWGVWWVWDARLTAELILLFLYLAFMALRWAIADPRRADRACAVLVLVGVINIPNVYFSVLWWNSIHQSGSASLVGSPAFPGAVIAGMLVSALAFCMYATAVVLARVRCLMLERDTVPLWIAQEE